jgi:hypothetical protein
MLDCCKETAATPSSSSSSTIRGTPCEPIAPYRCALGHIVIQFARLKYFLIDILVQQHIRPYLLPIFVIPFASGCLTAFTQFALFRYRTGQPLLSRHYF